MEEPGVPGVTKHIVQVNGWDSNQGTDYIVISISVISGSSMGGDFHLNQFLNVHVPNKKLNI